MAFSRAAYSPEEIARSIADSTSIIDSVMDRNRFLNCNPCRIALGVTAGNDVSMHSVRTAVDVESTLRGLDRAPSKCLEGAYAPVCAKGCPGTEGLPCGDISCRTDSLTHLKECSMFETNARPADKGYSLPALVCPSKKELRHQYEALPSVPRGMW